MDPGNISQAPKIAKLVYNSNFTMVYGTYNYSYWGLQTERYLGGLTFVGFNHQQWELGIMATSSRNLRLHGGCIMDTSIPLGASKHKYNT